MSRFDYDVSREIAKNDHPFASLIMAAMSKADSTNIEKLAAAFPEIYDEVRARYNAPGGMLESERTIGDSSGSMSDDGLEAVILFARRQKQN